MFVSASENSEREFEERDKARMNMLQFGISFLDDACLGIQESDLILLGAPSGLGKTELCCSIALTNLVQGKRVHYIALEAERYEIERRLKYKIFSGFYFNTPNRPAIECKLSYDRWRLGYFKTSLGAYEERTNDVFKSSYNSLFLYYKGDKFGLSELIEAVSINAQFSDLIIVDHVHYFDHDDDNENRAMKEIAKTTRMLALDEGKPILLVSHLRKRDRFNNELAAGLDEFMGSSDLYKIATKVITMAPGGLSENGNYETFFRVPKNRFNGSCTRYLARMFFNPRTNCYEETYRLGSANCTRDPGFEELNHSLYPEWAHRPPPLGGGNNSNAPRQPSFAGLTRRKNSTPPHWSDGDDE